MNCTINDNDWGTLQDLLHQIVVYNVEHLSNNNKHHKMKLNQKRETTNENNKSLTNCFKLDF